MDTSTSKKVDAIDVGVDFSRFLYDKKDFFFQNAAMFSKINILKNGYVFL